MDFFPPVVTTAHVNNTNRVSIQSKWSHDFLWEDEPPHTWVTRGRLELWQLEPYCTMQICTPDKGNYADKGSRSYLALWCIIHRWPAPLCSANKAIYKLEKPGGENNPPWPEILWHWTSLSSCLLPQSALKGYVNLTGTQSHCFGGWIVPSWILNWLIYSQNGLCYKITPCFNYLV